MYYFKILTYIIISTRFKKQANEMAFFEKRPFFFLTKVGKNTKFACRALSSGINCNNLFYGNKWCAANVYFRPFLDTPNRVINCTPLHELRTTTLSKP